MYEPSIEISSDKPSQIIIALNYTHEFNKTHL